MLIYHSIEKKMVKNKNSFDLLKDVDLIVTLSNLNKKKFYNKTTKNSKNNI